MTHDKQAFGIDIGGTGMKGAPVSLDSGELAAARFRIPTPTPSTPQAMAEVALAIVDHHDWRGNVGICLPAVVQHGIVRTAANIDDTWIGVDGDQLFTETLKRPVTLLNDADAAGLAEMRWGAGVGVNGTVLLLTFGTGIGSGLFVDGQLVPNTELGHLELDGHDAETRAAASVMEREDLDYDQWAERVNRYLSHVADLFSPDLIILGGGVSKSPDRWVPKLNVSCELTVAKFANNAGIAGAAIGQMVVGPA